MSACVRELFQRMAALDPQLRTQLSEWLAYHLSNFDFMWPWAKWSYILQAPPHDAQRCCPLVNWISLASSIVQHQTAERVMKRGTHRGKHKNLFSKSDILV